MIVNPLVFQWQIVAKISPDQPALLGTDGKTISTFLELEMESQDWQTRLAFLPVRSTVGIQIGNDPAWPAILLALWRSNHIALPLDATLGSEQTEHILNTAGASAHIRKDEILRKDILVPPTFLPDTCLCKVTSGTTCVPRLIEFSANQLAADCDNICNTMELQNTDINYGAIPFSHSYGFSNLLTPLLTRGIRLVVAEDYLPHSLINGMEKSGTTVLPGIPILYQCLVRLGLTLPSSVRLCITAGAPMNADIAHQFFKQNLRKIHSFYGTSECGGICYDESENPDVQPGFVGKALNGVQIKPSMDEGKIVVQSLAVGSRYYPVEKSDTLLNGNFYPQDITLHNEAGLRIIGRDSDFVNIAGKKLDPNTVQTVIEKIPGVLKTVVFGIPHPQRGEIAVAAVECNDLCSDTIMAACRKSLAIWQVPTVVWICDALPQDIRGKINRKELIKQYLSQRASSSLK